MNETPTYNVWLTLLLSHITADGKFYPIVEYQIKTDAYTTKLFTALYNLQIVPGEAFRYLCRCYPEIIEQIRLVTNPQNLSA